MALRKICKWVEGYLPKIAVRICKVCMVSAPEHILRRLDGCCSGPNGLSKDGFYLLSRSNVVRQRHP